MDGVGVSPSAAAIERSGKFGGSKVLLADAPCELTAIRRTQSQHDSLLGKQSGFQHGAIASVTRPGHGAIPVLSWSFRSVVGRVGLSYITARVYTDRSPQPPLRQAFAEYRPRWLGRRWWSPIVLIMVVVSFGAIRAPTGALDGSRQGRLLDVESRSTISSLMFRPSEAGLWWRVHVRGRGGPTGRPDRLSILPGRCSGPTRLSVRESRVVLLWVPVANQRT